MSRDPNELTPELQVLYEKFCEEMDKAGIRFILTCTKRTPEEQAELYSRGRSKPGRIVTWTLKSKHIEGKAFDIAILINGEVSWKDSDYIKAGHIGEDVGLVWGGSWKKKDLPHFELA
jgi:peptidoglycan L-alanyl-D-glutamate endopeptidase CwlK